MREPPGRGLGPRPPWGGEDPEGDAADPRPLYRDEPYPWRYRSDRGSTRRDGRSATRQAPGAQPAGRPWIRWGGSAPTWAGVAIVVGGAALGGLATVVMHTEPGTVLGAVVLAATAAATLLVRPRAAYLIIPVPALAYGAAALLAGLVHDRAADTSRTALAVSAAQWAAAGFLWIAATTALAIAVTLARWPWLARGQHHPAPPPSATPPASPNANVGAPLRRHRSDT